MLLPRLHLYGDVYSSPGLDMRRKQLLACAFLAEAAMPDQLFGHALAGLRCVPVSVCVLSGWWWWVVGWGWRAAGGGGGCNLVGGGGYVHVCVLLSVMWKGAGPRRICLMMRQMLVSAGACLQMSATVGMVLSLQM